MRTCTITTHLFVYGGMYTYMRYCSYVFMQPGMVDVSALSLQVWWGRVLGKATRVALSRYDSVVCWHLCVLAFMGWQGVYGEWYQPITGCSMGLTQQQLSECSRAWQGIYGGISANHGLQHGLTQQQLGVNAPEHCKAYMEEYQPITGCSMV